MNGGHTRRTVLKYRSRTSTWMQITIQYGSRSSTLCTEFTPWDRPLRILQFFFTPFDQESDVFLTCKKYPKWRGTDFQQSGKSNRSQQSAMSSVSHLSTSSKNSIWPDEYKGIKDTWCVMRFEYFSFMNLIQFLVLITGKSCLA